MLVNQFSDPGNVIQPWLCQQEDQVFDSSTTHYIKSILHPERFAVYDRQLNHYPLQSLHKPPYTSHSIEYLDYHITKPNDNDMSSCTHLASWHPQVSHLQIEDSHTTHREKSIPTGDSWNDLVQQFPPYYPLL